MLTLNELRQLMIDNQVFYHNSLSSSGYVVKRDGVWYYINRFLMEVDGRIEITFPVRTTPQSKFSQGWSNQEVA